MLRPEKVADATSIQQELVVQHGVADARTDSTLLLVPSNDDLQTPFDDHLNCDGCDNDDTDNPEKPSSNGPRPATDIAMETPTDLQHDGSSVDSPDQSPKDVLVSKAISSKSALNGENDLVLKLYASDANPGHAPENGMPGEKSISDVAIDDASSMTNSPSSIAVPPGTNCPRRPALMHRPIDRHRSQCCCPCFVYVFCLYSAESSNGFDRQDGTTRR